MLLVTLFRPVPRGLMWVGWAGTICSALVLVQAERPLPKLPSLMMVLYFFLMEGWAGWALLNGARHTSGVSRYRMDLAGLGSLTFAAHEELLRDVLSSGLHLLRMINDILDLSKVEAGKMAFDPKELDVKPLVEEVVKGLRPLAEEKGLRLRAEFGRAIQGQLCQAILPL